MPIDDTTKGNIIYLRNQGKKIREIVEIVGKSSRDVVDILGEHKIREAKDSKEDKELVTMEKG
ncbi:MAG: hypothetical protein WBW34_09560 [Nitrososphaeraceae archaeon]